MTSIYRPPLQVANPAWSPDGSSFAFIAGLMSDEPAIGGDVFIVDSRGGEARNLTPDMKASATWLTWTPQNAILFGEHVDGDAGIATVDPRSGRIEQRFRDAGQLTAGPWGTDVSLARDGKTAAVYAVRSACHQRSGPAKSASGSRSRRAMRTRAAWGDAKSIHWKSDGFDVQGWLIFPRDLDPAEKYPMVVSVHGGPASAVTSGVAGLARL